MRIVYFDTETTGLNPKEDRIIELALLIVDDKKIVESYDVFVDTGFEITSEITDLTGITNEMIESDGVEEVHVANDLYNRIIEGSLMVAHNCQFDLNFIYELLVRYYSEELVLDLFRSVDWLDTLTVFKDRKGYPHKLSDLVDYYNLGDFNFHRAIDDAKVLPYALFEMNSERDDVLLYMNVFGFNKKYGVSGVRFDFIDYVEQDFHNGIVEKDGVLPLIL